MTTPKRDLAEAVTRPFVAILQEIGDGILAEDCGEAMREVVTAVVETGKPGTVTITINVDVPGGDGKRGRIRDTTSLVVSGKVAAKRPRLNPPPSVFFNDEQANLTRTNPMQPELPLRALTGGQAPLRDEEIS
jgi:hypothetical protein